MTTQIDWHEEGQKAYIASVLKPAHFPKNYPTQDKYTAADEAEFIKGWRAQKATFERGEGFSGMESYAAELDEERRQLKENP